MVGERASLAMKIITLRSLVNVRLTKLKVVLSVVSVARRVALWVLDRAANRACSIPKVVLVLGVVVCRSLPL